MTRLHVILWLWKGWRAIYDRRDINAVATMLRERGQLPDDSRLLLITNQERDWAARRTAALGVEEFPLWPDPVKMAAGRPNCYLRLRIFDVRTQRMLGIREGDTVVSLDADSIIDGAFSQLLAPFADGTHTFAAMEGRASRIHGSCFGFIAGTHQHLWSLFHPQLSPIMIQQPWHGHARPHGSDQAWMTRNVKGEHLWRREQGCYSWSLHGLALSPRHTANSCYWSFAGPVKPSAELVRQVRPDLHDIWTDAYNRETPA